MINLGVLAGITGMANAYNQHSEKQQNADIELEKYKKIQSLAYDNALKQHSAILDLDRVNQQKTYEFQKEQEKKDRIAKVSILRDKWNSDPTMSPEDREYNEKFLDLAEVYGEGPAQAIINNWTGLKPKERKDHEAVQTLSKKLKEVKSKYNDEQLRDATIQQHIKDEAMEGLSFYDLTKPEHVFKTHFPIIEKESPSNIPNDLEAFTKTHPASKGRRYQDLTPQEANTIYTAWKESSIANSNNRMGDEFVIAARQVYPGIDPNQIQGEAMNRVREQMAKNKAEDAGKRERAVQDERPMDASVQTQISALQTALQMADQTELIFNDNWVGKLDKHKGSVREYTGWIEDDEVILRGNVESMKDMLLRAKSGAQINEAEYTRLSRLVPDTNMQSNVFKAAMKRFKNELSLTIENKIKFATTSKKEIKEKHKPKSDPLGLFK